MIDYVIHYDICAFIISAVVMTFFFCSPRLHNRLERVFMLVGCTVLIINILDVAAVLLDGRAPEPVLLFLNLFYLLLLHVLPCLMLLYLLMLTGRLCDLGYGKRIAIVVPYAFDVVLLCTSPFNHLAFTVTNQHYEQGPLAFMVYISAFIYILCGLKAVVFSPNHLTRRRKIAATSFIQLQICAVAIQYFYSDLLIIDLSAAISLMIMYIELHSSAEITDTLTGAYNSSALQLMVADRMNDKKPFPVMGFALHDLQQIRKTYGKNAAEALLCKMADTLNKTMGGSVVKMPGEEFCVLLPEKCTMTYAQQLIGCLPRRFEYQGYEIEFASAQFLIDGRSFNNNGEFLELLFFALEQLHNGTQTGLTMIDGAYALRFHRLEKVRTAIHNAIRTHRVDVVYQPIVRVNDGHIVAAEALMRIEDPELGQIPPSEFIPLAEQEGLILELGACMRHKVWSFAERYDLRAAGLDHISINLSGVECVQKKVMDAILEEEQTAGTERGLLCLEITETAAINSLDSLRVNMNRMAGNGFTFHLDDYGTGYAGMTNLLSLPFHAIKLDRSILTLSEEDAQRRELVRRTLSPLHTYGLQVVCEGVETPKQAQMIHDWDIDFIQGYLYSKPLPEQEFVRIAALMPRQMSVPAR